MKKIFILLFALLPFVNFAQTVSADADLGDRALYTCWGFQSFNVATNTIISGSHSFRSGQLSSTSNISSIISPWINAASGQISFKMRFDVSNAQTRTMVLSYIPIDETATNNQGTPVDFERVSLVPSSIAVNNFSFRIPTDVIGKTVRFRISFFGEGGSNRAIVDDIVISGTFAADPSAGCLPIRRSVDTDGDGIIDSEDDFPTDASRAFRSFLTNQNYSTLKFEDLWPAKGDFDFNDLVNDLRISVVSNANNEVVELIVESRTRAIGASFRNGLGLELTGISPFVVQNVTGHVMSAGTIHKLESNNLESGQEFATIILFDDANLVLQRTSGGTGINVDPLRPFSEIRTQQVVVSFEVGKIKSSDLFMGMLNPFLIVNQTRGREIHLAGKQPTRLADGSLFGSSSDNSKVGSQQTYVSKDDNLPWAIWINESIPYMQERVVITKGFELLKDWANSRGEKAVDWYLDKPGHINREVIIRQK